LCCLTSLALVHAAGQETRRGLREVGVQLLAHLAIQAPSRRDGLQPLSGTPEEAHRAALT
jgi:hypothetical protein